MKIRGREAQGKEIARFYKTPNVGHGEQVDVCAVGARAGLACAMSAKTI
ncbi:MAG: hypothetical protein LBK67_01710 [Coriobacteriales bacterium]|jgi:hypothetical protein|nr:hypothetical protein [Coriobacteriales bacterium]